MAAPNIEGTYQLVRRELPDGTVQHPPKVKGMMTYTKEFRNFSVLWEDGRGGYYTECYVARYALTDNEYTETAEYLITHDPMGGKGLGYDLSESRARSPVTLDGNRLRFALPQSFERALSITVEFEGNGFKAVARDRFIDYWEKVA